ncbi:helix-turn-helix domain-containing protein [Oscillibacter sp. CU971]|uniref:helix-turn-helix domain-containing protein n=1 Tax=Oscillibacter sp. CU971 TaxID=2780102 RepID=UPI001FAF10B3|nr:helix-turn-helix transcriptional regulator [Oscillibacter sp. CU971]
MYDTFLEKVGLTLKSVMELFRELREDHDYSQSDIAAVLGISQQHYSKYETGEYEFPLRHFITLAKYYSVSADYLIGRCSYDEKKPLEMVYVTRDCTCEKLVQDILSLSEHGREAVVEYIELQRLKERQKK